MKQLNVVVPYVNLSQRLVVRLKQEAKEYPISIQYADTSTGYDAYFNLVSKLWKEGRDVVIVEQDKVPEPGALKELWTCGADWCYFPIKMKGMLTAAQFPTLCCVKFTGQVMKDNPRVMEEVGKLDAGFGKKHWDRLDLLISGVLGEFVDAHAHAEGRVEHLHDKS